MPASQGRKMTTEEKKAAKAYMIEKFKTDYELQGRILILLWAKKNPDEFRKIMTKILSKQQESP